MHPLLLTAAKPYLQNTDAIVLKQNRCLFRPVTTSGGSASLLTSTRSVTSKKCRGKVLGRTREVWRKPGPLGLLLPSKNSSATTTDALFEDYRLDKETRL